MLLVGDGELTVAGTLALYILLVSKTSSQNIHPANPQVQVSFRHAQGDK